MKNHSLSKMVDTGDYLHGVSPQVHPIENSRELLEVYRLHYEYAKTHKQPMNREDGLWIPHPDFDHYALTTILVASLNNEVVGTLTLTRDGSQGLVCDKLYSQTNNLTRMSGRQVAEIWRFVVNETHPHSAQIAQALANEAIVRLKAGGIATCLLSIGADEAALLRTQWNAITLVQNNNQVFLRCDLKNLPVPKTKKKKTTVQ